MILIEQQTNVDCSIAAMATVTGLPYSVVKNNVPGTIDKGLAQWQIIATLNILEITHIEYHTTILVQGRTYLITVPSLNTFSNHSVVIDYRGELPLILDPCPKLKYKEIPSQFADIIEII